MSLIVIPNTFSVGAVIVASQHNANFSTIYTDYNGNIDNTNIAATAAIADTKLAQITTASKVSGAALTALTSVVSGAGALPLVNMSSAIKIVKTTYDMTTATGTQTITGAGFTPTGVLCFADVDSTTAFSIGMDNATNHYAIYDASAGSTLANSWGFTNNFILLNTTGGNQQNAVVNSFNSDGCVLGWTKSSSPTGTANLVFMFFK